MPIDYKHTDYDLATANGDFVKAESTVQHMNLLTVSNRGDWRQYPLTGIGIINFLLDDTIGDLYKEIKSQYESDGMVVDKLNVFNNGVVEEEAHYQ